MTSDERWDEIVARCGPLWEVLGSCRLGLSAREAGRALGLSSGAALERQLRDSGLPPYRALRDWVYVAMIVDETANGDRSLASWSFARGSYPAVYYRFVVRITGHTWKQIAMRGAGWVRSTAMDVWAPFLRGFSS
jgi:hypothetical protein